MEFIEPDERRPALSACHISDYGSLGNRRIRRIPESAVGKDWRGKPRMRGMADGNPFRT